MQINVYRKVIGVKSESKIAVSKSSVQQLRDHLLILLQQPLTDKQQELIKTITEPATLVGRETSHTWSVDHVPVVYKGTVLHCNVTLDEFELKLKMRKTLTI